MLHIHTHIDRYGDGLDSDDILVNGLRTTRFARCHIGIVPEGQSGRQVHGGPLVPGPWGFAVAHAIVIDRFGTVKRHSVAVDVGEPFTVDGLPGVWMFRDPRVLEGDGPKLVPYEG